MKYERSFTLIELLIVVSFILLFTGISITYYDRYTEQKKLENASKKMSEVLDLAHAKTITGDSSLCGYNDKTSAKVNFFSVDIISNNQDKMYKMMPNCLVGTPTPIYYPTESNIIFPTPTLSVAFTPITGNTRCNYIYVKNTVLNGGSCRYVKVTDTALVSDEACSTCDTCPAPSPGVNSCP